MISNSSKRQRLIEEGQQSITLKKLVKFSHYETIFKFVFFFVLIVIVNQIQNIIFLFYISLYSFDIIQFQQFLREKNFRRFDWKDIKWLFFGLILIHITKELNKKFVTNFVERKLDSKYIGIDRQLRVQKIVKWIYDTIYYSFATIFAFIAFRNEKWFPTEFGGTNFQETLYDFPNFPDVLSLEKNNIKL